MYKIQCKVQGNDEWFDMVNMPDFQDTVAAEKWLEDKGVQNKKLGALGMDFRVVPLKTAALPFTA